MVNRGKLFQAILADKNLIKGIQRNKAANESVNLFLSLKDPKGIKEASLDIVYDHTKFPVALGALYQILTSKDQKANNLQDIALQRIADLSDALKIFLKQKPEEALLIILSYGLKSEYLDELQVLDVFQGEQFAVLLRAGLKSVYFKNESLECLVHCSVNAPDSSPMRQNLLSAIINKEISLDEVIQEIKKIMVLITLRHSRLIYKNLKMKVNQLQIYYPRYNKQMIGVILSLNQII